MNAQSAEDHPSDATPARGIPAVAEALGYVGGALAAAAAIALLVASWPALGMVGHVGIGAVLAAAGLGAGFALAHAESAAVQRLARFLLFAGVAGVGVAVGFAVRDPLYARFAETAADLTARSDAAEWGWFAGALGVALSGGAVWLRERSALQHLAFGAGVAAASLLVLPLVPVEGPDWGAGAVLVVVALAWGALTLRGLLEPRIVGLVLATLGVLGGIELMAITEPYPLVWALWLGVVVAAALIWAGSHAEEPAVLGIATVGLMVLSGQLIAEYMGFGVGTAIALIAVGFALLGVGVRLTLRAVPGDPQRRRVAREVASYLGIGLAMGGAGILMADAWDELGVAGRVIVPLVGAAVAYACAYLLRGEETSSARRVSQTLLAIGVLSAAIAGAMVAKPVAEDILGTPGPQGAPSENWTMLVGSLAGTLFGAATWWFRKGALTQIALGVAVFVDFIAVLGFLEGEPPLVMAVVMALVGTVWVVLGALEHLVPARTAIAVGSMLTLQGLMWMLNSSQESFAAFAGLGIAYGVADIAASIYFKRGTLLGFGAVMVVLFSTTLLMETFGDQASAPVLMLTLGVVLIAVAVAVARIAPRIRRSH